MKNKILHIISILLISCFLFHTIMTINDLSDDCYFGNGTEVTNLKYFCLAFALVFVIFFIIQIWSFVKNKSAKIPIFTTAFSVVLVAIFTYYTHQFYEKTHLEYQQSQIEPAEMTPADGVDPPYKPPVYTQAQQDSLQKEYEIRAKEYEINLKKAVAKRGCDSLILTENEVEIVLQTKGQNTFKLNELVERNKKFQFLRDPSGEKMTVKGIKRYEINGRRYIDNNADGFMQPFAFSKQLNHPAIADYQVICDFEATFNLAIGLNEGYEMRLKNGKMIIKKNN